MELKDALSLTADKVAVVGSDGKPLALTDKQKADLRNDLYYFYADAGTVTLRDFVDNLVSTYDGKDPEPTAFATMVYQFLQAAHGLRVAQISGQGAPAASQKAPQTPAAPSDGK
jgi:hypothetical protein